MLMLALLVNMLCIMMVTIIVAVVVLVVAWYVFVRWHRCISIVDGDGGNDSPVDRRRW